MKVATEGCTKSHCLGAPHTLINLCHVVLNAAQVNRPVHVQNIATVRMRGCQSIYHADTPPPLPPNRKRTPYFGLTRLTKQQSYETAKAIFSQGWEGRCSNGRRFPTTNPTAEQEVHGAGGNDVIAFCDYATTGPRFLLPESTCAQVLPQLSSMGHVSPHFSFLTWGKTTQPDPGLFLPVRLSCFSCLATSHDAHERDPAQGTFPALQVEAPLGEGEVAVLPAVSHACRKVPHNWPPACAGAASAAQPGTTGARKKPGCLGETSDQKQRLQLILSKKEASGKGLKITKTFEMACAPSQT